MILLPLLAAASTLIPSHPDLGKAAGRCEPGMVGPRFLVRVEGLKDRRGRLKLELYPANDQDFLAPDNVLITAGRPFARVEVEPIADTAIELCIRAPRPGTYALALLHDRDADRRFTLTQDGIGFAGNPRLGLSKPKAAAAAAQVGGAAASVRIVLNYRQSLLGFGPLRR